MSRRTVLACAALLAACASGTEGPIQPGTGTPDGPAGVVRDGPLALDAPSARGPDGPVSGVIFDPCVPAPQAGYDPVAAGLDACCAGTGPAHCVPSSQVVARLADDLSPCPGGASVCMPDPIIVAGGRYAPPACTSSVTRTAGACLSQCIPMVADNPLAGLLRQDSCGAGELCIPCQNPADHSDTGACSLIAQLCPAAAPDARPPPADAACVHTGPPVLDPSTLPACSPACAGAHCLPASAVPAAQQALLDSCPAGAGVAGLCAPDLLIETGGAFLPKPCTSSAGAEGRCLSTCLPAVADQADLLPVDVCAAGERCAPCFDPTASDPTAATGACTVGCDQPKKPPVVLSCPWAGPDVVDPARFPACAPACGGAHCVPAAMIPEGQQALLAPCPGGFCAPDPVIASDDHLLPKSCTSIAGAEGRCLSTCLPDVAARASLLPQADCPSGTRCAPCYDPTSSTPETPTGACALGCDQPKLPPVILSCPWVGPAVLDPATFPSCCAGAHCLPAALVPPAEQGMLATCAGGFCTPDPIIQSDDHWVPASCRSIAGVEGRCLSTCLPEVSSQPLLPRSSCPADARCVPCYDPLASNPRAPTGACSLACDHPAEDPVVLSCPWTGPPVLDPGALPGCCAGAHCMPDAYVPPSEAGLLAPCAGGRCTPDPFIESGGETPPPPCEAFQGTGVPGRCLSICLPLVAAQSGLERSSCQADERCAPCADPFSGADTGACGIACDRPPAPPFTFPPCCWDGGSSSATCVPRTQLGGQDTSQLTQDACSDAYLCVPTEFLPGGSGGQGCSFEIWPFTFSGSCYSNCLDLGIGSIFPQGTCPGNHSCIQCDVAPGGSPGC